MKKFKSCVIIFMLALASVSVSAELNKSDRQKIVDFLISINASYLAAEIEKNNLNATDFLQRTALTEAVEHNNIDIVKLLIKAGADVNAKTYFGGNYAAYMFFALKNNIEIAKLLIKAGADVNARHINGYTALMYAVGNNAVDVAKLLIKAGADINAKNDFGETAVIIAEKNNSQDMKELLIAAGAQTYLERNGYKYYSSDQTFFSALEAMSKNKNAIYTYIAASVPPKEEIMEDDIILRFGTEENIAKEEGFWAYAFCYQHRNYRIAIALSSIDLSEDGGFSDYMDEILFEKNYTTRLQQQEIMSDLKMLVEKLMY